MEGFYLYQTTHTCADIYNLTLGFAIVTIKKLFLSRFRLIQSQSVILKVVLVKLILIQTKFSITTT